MWGGVGGAGYCVFPVPAIAVDADGVLGRRDANVPNSLSQITQFSPSAGVFGV